MISIIPFIGGKSEMLNKIYEIAGKIKHSIFVDAFGGSGKVVFNYPYNVRKVYNDLDYTLYNLFKTIKERPNDFLTKLREVFKKFDSYPYNPIKLLEIKRTYIDKGLIKDDVELAVWTFLIYTFVFGGNWRNKILIFSRPNHLTKIADILNHPERKIDQWHKALQDIELYNKDYKEIVDMFNHTDTLLFLDPPYLGYEKEYRVAKKGMVFEVLDYVKDFKGSIIFTHNAKERHKGEEWMIEKMMEILREDGYNIVEVTRTTRQKGKGFGGYVNEIIAWRCPDESLSIRETERILGEGLPEEEDT